MYEGMSYEGLLARMINRAEAWARSKSTTLDPREGSLTRTASAPAAAEFMLMLFELNRVLDETYADTASWDFLVRRCAERGIVPEPATSAIWLGEFNMDVPPGSRFTFDQLVFEVVDMVSTGKFRLKCVTPGEVGNRRSGDLVPVDFIDGLEWARLVALLVPGQNMESVDHLRSRYFESIDHLAFGGNVADYKEKVNRLPGVGGCKVYPVWDGGGTVKIVFINTMFQVPSGDLVDDVQTAIDPVQNQGVGLGLAPIGHVVTVLPVDETKIDVETSLSYRAGWDWNDVKPYVEEAIDNYFHELSSEWDAVDWELDPDATLIVRISYIETRLLRVEGVVDVSGTKLNGAAENLTIPVDSIPVRGIVTDA